MTPEEFPLRQIFGVLRRRGWLLAQAVVIVTAAAVALALRAPNEYQASAVLLVGGPKTPALGELTADARLTAGQAARLLRTRDVANRVSWATGAVHSPDELLSRVSTAADPRDGFTTVTARGRTAAEAALLANSFARQFIALRAETPYVGLRKAVQAIQRQLATVPDEGPERDALLAQLTQLETLAAVPAADVEIVDLAVPPADRVAPTPVRDGILGAILGLLLGIGVVLLLEALDPRVKRFEELQRLVPAPQLAGVPAAVFRRPSRLRRRLRRQPPVVTMAHRFPEPFERVRTSLLVFNAERDLKTILVTSPQHVREGTTTVAANLALSLTKVGLKVCAVDADLRRPRLARHFGLDDQAIGLSDVIEGASLKQAIQRFPVPGAASFGNGNGKGAHATPELAVLSAGTSLAAPAELLAGKGMQDVLDELEKKFDVVVLDCTPVLAQGDTLPLLARADGTLLVVRLFHTARKSISRSVRVIEGARGHLLGVVGTGVPPRELREEGYGPWPVSDPQPTRVA